ncbi:hypothetical protein [Gluconobacter cerinus]|uniref:hypothetical protein n=1 Tax=Gluconobacter cerinus TaxID=38307 RepID=UPI001B8AD032|nr:hypothetical protein [Gluconobacter cerinus]MBS1034996.1 hypothetical protein [Gluconobacter cerinus]
MPLPHNRRGLDVKIAYPWPVDRVMPEDVSGLSIDEQIYPLQATGLAAVVSSQAGEDP